MTTHELAKKLLEGPDVKVVIQGHEPNDDTFDEITRADEGTAWVLAYAGSSLALYDTPPSPRSNLKQEAVAVVVLR